MIRGLAPENFEIINYDDSSFIEMFLLGPVSIYPFFMLILKNRKNLLTS